MYDHEREIAEAIEAGERSLRSLNEAKKYLDSASNWGVVDMIGGNFLSGLMKHSKIDNAKQALQQAKEDLTSFENELKDVQGLRNVNIDIGDFLTFADFFFDGLIADVMVQSKISEARRQVNEAIPRVQNAVEKLMSLQ